ALRCMTETPFTGHAGPYLTMPPRNVVPKPHQKPHPPVWLACTRRETIHLAAQKGIGALSFAFFDPEEARHWVDDYYATLAREARRARTSSATRWPTTTCSAGTARASPTCGRTTSTAGPMRATTRRRCAPRRPTPSDSAPRPSSTA